MRELTIVLCKGANQLFLNLELAPSDLGLAPLELWLALSHKISVLSFRVCSLTIISLNLGLTLLYRAWVRARVKHRHKHLCNTNQMTHDILLSMFRLKVILGSSQI